MDPVAAKCYKFEARCELNLIRERITRPHKCGMHVHNGIFRRQNGMFQNRKRQRRWFARNPQGVVVTCSTHFLFVFHIRIATIVRENYEIQWQIFILVPISYYYKIRSDILANSLGRCPPRASTSRLHLASPTATLCGGMESFDW